MDTGNITGKYHTMTSAVPMSDFKKIQAVEQNVATQSATAGSQHAVINTNGVDSPQQNPLSREDLAKVVKQVNTAFQDEKRSIQFSIDDESGRTVIKVLDSSTGKEIRQFPSEDILEISRNITAQLNKKDVTSGVLLPGKTLSKLA